MPPTHTSSSSHLAGLGPFVADFLFHPCDLPVTTPLGAHTNCRLPFCSSTYNVATASSLHLAHHTNIHWSPWLARPGVCFSRIHPTMTPQANNAMVLSGPLAGSTLLTRSARICKQHSRLRTLSSLQKTQPHASPRTTFYGPLPNGTRYQVLTNYGTRYTPRYPHPRNSQPQIRTLPYGTYSSSRLLTGTRYHAQWPYCL
jgi:hypothetical protein